jgi:hypothetical protein
MFIYLSRTHCTRANTCLQAGEHRLVKNAGSRSYKKYIKDHIDTGDRESVKLAAVVASDEAKAEERLRLAALKSETAAIST